MRKRITWVVLADAQRTRILQHDGPARGLHQVATLTHVDPPTREQGSDRPGRVHDSIGEARHAMETRVDWHRAEKTRFAREVSDYLEEGLARGSYERLILVAPPQFLGDLRRAIDPAVRNKVSAEIDKDLTAMPLEEVEEQIATVLAV